MEHAWAITAKTKASSLIRSTKDHSKTLKFFNLKNFSL